MPGGGDDSVPRRRIWPPECKMGCTVPVIPLLLFGRQVESYRIMFKMTFVRTVTKGFILGKTAAANGDYFPSAQVIFVAIPVDNFKIAFYFKRAVAVHRNFCSGHIAALRRESRGRFRIYQAGFKPAPASVTC